MKPEAVIREVLREDPRGRHVGAWDALDSLVAERDRYKAENEKLRERVAAWPDQNLADRYKAALEAIQGPEDAGYWIEVYRTAGGGYEGLQAIARAALERNG